MTNARRALSITFVLVGFLLLIGWPVQFGPLNVGLVSNTTTTYYLSPINVPQATTGSTTSYVLQPGLFISQLLGLVIVGVGVVEYRKGGGA